MPVVRLIWLLIEGCCAELLGRGGWPIRLWRDWPPAEWLENRIGGATPDAKVAVRQLRRVAANLGRWGSTILTDSDEGDELCHDSGLRFVSPYDRNPTTTEAEAV